jgi:integrase
MQQPTPRAITLRKCFLDYITTRSLRPKTLDNYKRRLIHIDEWMDEPVRSITKEMVEHRHRELSQTAGKVIANDVFRTLRALLRFAQYKYEEQAPAINPVVRLSEIRAWNRERRRRRVITPGQLKAWYHAVLGMKNTTARDAMLLILFTGMRKREALNLEWSQVDLVNGIIKLPDIATKNGEEHDIPLSDYTWRLLQYRRFMAQTNFVFPNEDNTAPVPDISVKAIQAVIKKTGVPFSPHDLRRTFISVADDLEIKNEVIKELVGHKVKDVTEGYIVRSTERLRRNTQQITAKLMSYLK